MKFKKVYLSVSCALMISTNAYAGDWVDDYFDVAVTTSPSTFENQKRGFYSLGGFQGRINTSSDPLFSVNLPKASGGCKGLDLFMGSFSMLDEEFLVQKLENAMQAAPAIAFDMALKSLTKEFSETLAKFEQITNMLNGIQVNDCAIAEGAVQAVLPVEWGGATMEQTWGKVTSQFKLDSGAEKNNHAAKEGLKSGGGEIDENLETEIDGCDSELLDLFGTPGSLLEKASDEFGMDDYEDIVRGYIGDVHILMGAVTNLPTPQEVLPCDDNKTHNIDDFVMGISDSRNAGGACNNYLDDGVLDIIQDNMLSIANKISTRTAFTPDDLTFMNTSPLPVYAIMRDAVVNGTVQQDISSSSQLLAYAYANSMFEELHRNTITLLRKTKRVLQASSAAGPAKCNKDVFIAMHKPLENMEMRARKASRDMRAGYVNRLEEIAALSEYVDRRREINEREVKKQSQKTLGLPET